MIKCFLSHSSSDKNNYVRPLASHIRKETKIIDEETFEEGMSPMEEISRWLDATSLFVILISNSSLNSRWVQEELQKAKQLLDKSQLDRVYPIIIEHGITYDDSRIPGWMQDDLNIQLILKPTIAARKINARMTELSWVQHPRLKERQEIFVGRNEIIKEIEERLDDFSQQAPVALISSGLPSIGRKSLLQHAIRKSNMARESYAFPFIPLSSVDGIEDFILKIYDQGLVDITNIHDRLNGDMNSKIHLAIEITEQIIEEKERLLIEDRGVLIQGDGEIVDWFAEIITKVADREHLTFAIASQFRPKLSLNRTNPLFYSVSVREMESPECNGLLVRYSKFHSLSINKADYTFFSELLTGYPEQVLFAVDLIKEKGVFGAKKSSHAIQQYGSDKAKVVLDSYKNDESALDFIYFLSRFEFISYDVLFDIVDEALYLPILERLLVSSVCERMGASADYIRVNEVIRDYVSRNRFGLPVMFQAAIKKHVSSFVERYQDDDYDISDYIFSAQESLRSGNGIPDNIIIPSIFVKTIKRIYDEERNYADALTLADRVLQKERHLHVNTIDHIRFIKCQCLARLRRQDFFNEVRKIREPNKSFLIGFYYRLSGDYVRAEESLKNALKGGRRDPRVIGELVLVYLQSDEHNLAYDLALENYENRPGNLINANTYFACLILKEKNPENRKKLDSILNRLLLDSSDRAQEMAESAKARLVAYYENDETESMNIIEAAINRFPDVAYPVLTKADLAVYFKNAEKLNESVSALEKLTSRNAESFKSFIKYKAMLFALNGDLHKSKQLVNKELKGLIPTSLQRLYEKLQYLASVGR